MKRRILPSKRFWLYLLIGIVLLSSSGSDYFRQSKLEHASRNHSFSIFWWEVRHIPSKWVHLLWEMFPGNKPTDAERKLIVQDYLQSVRRLDKERARVEGSHFAGSVAGSSATKKATENISNDLEVFEREKESLRGKAEEAVEAVISDVVRTEGLGFPLGILFPPTDFRFDKPPLILVTSPRNVIRLEGTRLIQNDIKMITRSEIEQRIESDGITSALVDDLAGLGTYPAFVSDRYELRQLTRTAAHEWLHNYWIFRPLGRSMWDSSDMYTLNETAADIAGNELGDLAYQRLGGNLEASDLRYGNTAVAAPHLTRILRETRIKVDKLLSENNIDGAEEIMRGQHWNLRLGGYGIRKINQAYFAFRGNYADSPASVSPIGSELKEYRETFPTVGEFIKSVATVKNYVQFQLMLESVGDKRINSTDLRSNHSNPVLNSKTPLLTPSRRISDAPPASLIERIRR